MFCYAWLLTLGDQLSSEGRQGKCIRKRGAVCVCVCVCGGGSSGRSGSLGNCALVVLYEIRIHFQKYLCIV